MDSPVVLYRSVGNLEDVSGRGPATPEDLPAPGQILWRSLLDAQGGQRQTFLSGGGPLLWGDRVEAACL